MKRFLSIDWDFFIDATDLQRCTMFPDGGNENLPDSLRDYIWDTYYRNPKLEEMTILPLEFKYLLGYCRAFSGEALVTDSHKHIFDFIMENTKPDEFFEVYNIDFHHDLYDFKTSDEARVNCGNWATELLKERPGMHYVWVKREDSDVEVRGKVVSKDIVDFMTFATFQMNFLKGIEKEFQYLFLCRSAIWSPPHLDKKFVRAVKALTKGYCVCRYEHGIDKPRKYEKPSEFDGYKAMFDMVDQLHKKS